MSAPNDDEKKEAAPNNALTEFAAPITMLVEFETTSDDASTQVLSALGVAAECQLEYPHPGALVYHFARPDPETNPNILEFTEIYFNETEYWEHIKPRFKFGMAILNGFKDEYRKNRRYVMYGNLSESVINSGSGFDGKPIEGEGGFLVSSEPGSIDVDPAAFRPVMMKFRIHMCQTPTSDESGEVSFEPAAAKFREISAELSRIAAEQLAVTFAIHRLNEPELPDRFDIVSVWANEVLLGGFLKRDDVQQLFGDLVRQCVDDNGSLVCNLFGDQSVLPDVKSWTSDVLGGLRDNVNVAIRETDQGYVLHPQVRTLLEWQPPQGLCVYL